MDYTINAKPAMKLIGFQKIFNSETAPQEIPGFWDEFWEMYAANVYAGNAPATAQEQAFVDHEIGEFGVCIDDLGEDKSRYLIAGKYQGGEVPEGMTVYELPAGDWAVFDCQGQIPDVLQSAEAGIFSEWLPGHPEYEIAGDVFVEWYDPSNDWANGSDYHTQVWIPVRKANV